MDIDGIIMNKIYVTADCHGAVMDRFSFRQQPELRQLDSTDVVVVCGDIGIMWPGYEKEAKYVLNWLATKKTFTCLFIRGNHDNEPWWESCPATTGNASIRLLDGDLRVAAIDGVTYDNVFLVTSTAILDVCGKTCLCIGGAESTDAYNLYYPHEKTKIKTARSKREWHRVIGKSWWPNEGINIAYANAVLTRNYPDPWLFQNFDYIFTHQSPSGYLTSGYNYRKDRWKETDEIKFLENIRLSKNFKHWYHGHQHQFCTWTKEDEPPVTCLYYDFIDTETGEWLD